MLARAHRVTSGDDYRQIVRRGARKSVQGLTVSVLTRDSPPAPTRFGFIISKRVGVAVVRNRLRRRLKSIALELLDELPIGLDVVFRVHPEAAAWNFDELRGAGRSTVLGAVAKDARRAAPAPAHSRGRS